MAKKDEYREKFRPDADAALDREINDALSGLTTGDGVCTIVVPHTTCAVSVNENADPDVPADLVRALRAAVPLAAATRCRSRVRRRTCRHDEWEPN